MAKVSSRGLSSALSGGAETIVASATPPGRGALAVIRVSGRSAEDLSRRVCPDVSFKDGWRATLTALRSSEREVLEHAIVIPYPSPRSFTGEDMLEITVHGSSYLIEEVIEAFVIAGARRAEPGEFTRRAVANGKLAARSIHDYLSGGRAAIRMEVNIRNIPADEYSMPAGYEKRARRGAPTLPTDRRTGITEVEEVMTEEQARAQAERCLACHIDTIYDPLKCVLCNRCADVCPEKCLLFVPLVQVDMPAEQLETALETYGHDTDQPMTVLLKDDTICIRCGLCAARCPTEAMTMERFNFIESTG